MFDQTPIVLFLLQFYSKLCHSGYLEDVCMQPFDEGEKCSGKGPFSRGLMYYFSTEHEECLPFNYKGCGGNQNRFSAQDDCTDACQVDWFLTKNKKARKKTSSSDGIDSDYSNVDCGAAPRSGPCRAMIKQWYFEEDSNKCLPFNYGGCKGNGNRFNSEKQCQAACMRVR